MGDDLLDAMKRITFEPGSIGHDILQVFRENERLRAEVARLQHEADAAAERHVTIAETRADIAERELAALRDRIEKSPVRKDMFGKRVRLVVED